MTTKLQQTEVLATGPTAMGTMGDVALFDEQALGTLGLTANDLPQVRQIADRIDASNPLSVSEFGRDVATHTSSYSDNLLDQIRSSDLAEAGEKLTQVVNIARGLNAGALSDRRSKVPLIGPWIDKLKLSSSKIMSQFETAKGQIDALIEEVGQSQGGLAARNAALNEMFASVTAEHHLLGLHIAAGKVRLQELSDLGSKMRGQALNPADAQQLADLDAMVANLDKRIGDLQALQHSALQNKPAIRIIQANNQMMVDKFHAIREVTVPTWKRQFLLALTLNEQRNSVQLATAIDDATNELLRRNADLLHRNSVETARANQRQVIDVSTLMYVQDTLIKTVEDVISIHREGTSQRRAVEKQIVAMQGSLQARLTNKTTAEAV